MLDDNTNDNPNTLDEASAAPPAASSDDSPETPAKPARKAAARKAPAKKAPAKKAATRKTAAKKAAIAASAEEAPLMPAAEPAAEPGAEATSEAGAEGSAVPAKKAARKTAAKKTTTRRTATKKAAATTESAAEAGSSTTAEPAADAAPVEQAQADRTQDGAGGTIPLFQAPEPVKAPARRTRKTAATRAAEAAAAEAAEAAGAAAQTTEGASEPASQQDGAEQEATEQSQPQRRSRGRGGRGRGTKAAQDAGTAAETSTGAGAETEEEAEDEAAVTVADADGTEGVEGDTDEGAESDTDEGAEDESDEGTPSRRRRRRGGRRRRKAGDGQAEDNDEEQGDRSEESDEGGDADSDETDSSSSSSRRRRRRRRSGDDNGEGSDDPDNTVVRVRRTRSAEDQITALAGSTRLEAKKQRRREGREAGRRRAPIVSEAEFLARREAVERVMVIRQRKDLTQIAVLEDKVLVEHYVARESQTSLIGNVYLGRVQNVLPSMEAAFIDIGKGRNAVLYAGEVNWSALGHKEGQPRKIESVLSSGQAVLVQVTKDPVGHKGARLTSQISLAGRFLVYVPDGTTSGISRKLPDTERNRLKSLLKEIVPDTAGVIVRTAAEGASEDELTRDVERLKARWEDIEAKSRGNAPQMLYGEPDLTLKVVRDLFTEDFAKLVIEGDDAWDTVQGYVSHVAPDLQERLERYQPEDGSGKDVFAAYRIEEQIAKGLDRKVWLPSGGSLIIDRTEAMTVVDVNTGKFTGSGGNLEETVTKNNLEAAEEIVRQLRLRDIGGIIVVDFIDMVLESNRDLVVRRLVECLGRDRTRHQVAEVTSLGLVQMTRKRIGTGLLESFSHDCEHCQGRGVVVQSAPVEPRSGDDEGRRGGRRGRGGRGGDNGGDRSTGKAGGRSDQPAASGAVPSPKVVAAMAKPENAEKAAEAPEGTAPVTTAETTVETTADAASGATTTAEPAATEQPKVVTRPRRRTAGRPAAAPADTPAEAAPTPAEAALTPAAETPVESAVAAEAETPVEVPAAEQPKVVTRTRRRSASRPAAAPPESSVPAPAETPVVAEPVVAPVAAPSVAPSVAPAAAPAAETEAAPSQPQAPEKPKVVTRTRRRAASRPAGPPTDAAGATASGSTGEGAAEPLPESHVEHVPVKKKGARKR